MQHLVIQTNASINVQAAPFIFQRQYLTIDLHTIEPSAIEPSAIVEENIAEGSYVPVTSYEELSMQNQRFILVEPLASPLSSLNSKTINSDI